METLLMNELGEAEAMPLSSHSVWSSTCLACVKSTIVNEHESLFMS